MTVRGFGRLDGDEGFAEVFFDDVFVPDDAPCSASVEPGLERGHGHHRLRARPDAALARPLPGRRRPAGRRWRSAHRRPATDPLRDRVAEAWMRGRGLPAVHAARRSPTSSRAGRPGARSSLNKIFWSELDVRLHETALDLLGPAGASSDDAVEQGLPVLAVRADLRRHQRDPAQHRRRAGARPAQEVIAMRFAFTPSSRTCATPCATCWNACPPAVVRSGPTLRPAATLERRAGRDGRARAAGARGRRWARAGRELTWCRCSPRPGGRRCRVPVVETIGVAPAVLAAAGLADRVGTRAAADPAGRGAVRFAAGLGCCCAAAGRLRPDRGRRPRRGRPGAGGGGGPGRRLRRVTGGEADRAGRRPGRGRAGLAPRACWAPPPS